MKESLINGLIDCIVERVKFDHPTNKRRAKTSADTELAEVIGDLKRRLAVEFRT